VRTINITLKLTALPQAEAKGSTCFARPPLQAFLSIININVFVNFFEKDLIKTKIAITAESQTVQKWLSLKDP
jgi:hypothetical protein